MRSVVSDDGKVSIPWHLLDLLDIRAGEEIDFVAEQGRLVGVRVKATPETNEERLQRFDAYKKQIESVVGILDLGMTTDELMEELRGPRDLT